MLEIYYNQISLCLRSITTNIQCAGDLLQPTFLVLEIYYNQPALCWRSITTSLSCVRDLLQKPSLFTRSITTNLHCVGDILQPTILVLEIYYNQPSLYTRSITTNLPCVRVILHATFLVEMAPDLLTSSVANLPSDKPAVWPVRNYFPCLSYLRTFTLLRHIPLLPFS